MGRIILILCLAMVMTGCATEKVRTVYKDKPIPVYVVPTPPKVDRPQLEIDRLTPEQKENDGEVAKAYTVSVSQLQIYSGFLERIINKYMEMGNLSQDKLRELMADAIRAQASSEPGLFAAPSPTAEVNAIDVLKTGDPEDVVKNLDEILLYNSVDQEFNDIEEEAAEASNKDYKE